MQKKKKYSANSTELSLKSLTHQMIRGSMEPDEERQERNRYRAGEGVKHTSDQGRATEPLNTFITGALYPH